MPTCLNKGTKLLFILLIYVYDAESAKVVAEGISQVVRCIIIAVGVVLFPNQYGVVIFASGQV